MTEIYLGKPSANIEAWIKAHSQPAEHPETRFTFSGERTVSKNISGELGSFGSSIWTYDDEVDDVILDYDGSEKLFQGDLISVDIGKTVTSIGEDAFYGCNGLTNVTIGNGVTSIGERAFNSCSGLTSLTIGNCVESIGYDAFNSCTSLASVTIPSSVTSILSFAFVGCTSLASVTIPDSVTSIEDYAFFNCSGLTSITITANGGNAENVKQMLIAAGVSSSITWNMPS